MNTFVTDVLPANVYLWPFVYWGVVGALVLAAAARALWASLPSDGTDAIDLDLYETAALGDGAGPLGTAVVRLVLLSAVRLGGSRGNELVVSGPLPDGCHPVEEAVYRAITVGAWSARAHPGSATVVAAEGTAARLRALGLYPGRVGRALGLCVGVGGIGLAFVLFFAMSVRWEHPAVVPGGHPPKDSRSQGAGFCCMVATVALGFAALCLGAGIATSRTRRGQTVLARLRRQHPLRGTDDVPLLVALYGFQPLEAAGHADLKYYLDPPSAPDPNPPVV